MATITKKSDKWYVQIRRSFHKPIYKSFIVKADAIKAEVKANHDEENWSKEHIQVEIDRLLKDYKVAKPKRGFYKFVSF